MDSLRFENFADRWIDGLPVGNGKLAAMVWGGCEEDIVSLNHEWLWTGNYKERSCEEGAEFLPRVRQYLREGKNFQATALSALAFGGGGGITPLPRRMDSYQPAGELVLTHARATSVCRTLALNEGIVTSQKTCGGATEQPAPLTLTAFCHAGRGFALLRWQSAAPFDASLRWQRGKTPGTTASLTTTPQEISFSCDGGQGIGFSAKTEIHCDGTVCCKGDLLVISAATELVAVVRIGTEHLGIEKELAAYGPYTGFDALQQEQKRIFAEQMPDFALELRDENTAELESWPIERRCARLHGGQADPQLEGLFARFGVYLMVAGSMMGELPLHLQGKWNREVQPKWNSDYHLNINLQMNYWFTETLGMNACSRQMLDYLMTLLPKARQAAEKLYGCRGVWYPLSSDVWANATPEAYNYAVWISAAGWLSAHFWRYWRYTGDVEFLRNQGYPFLREAARFYADYAVYDENGTAQLMPSQSPENKYQGTGYFPVGICISSAMDVQIAWETLDHAVQAARILGQDANEAADWDELRRSLPPFRVGSDGRLLEWDSEDRREVEPGHRHFSHLYGVYPGQLFSPEQRTGQFAAARRSLDYRLSHSGGGTGWSRAWCACLFARFLDAAQADGALRHLIAEQCSSTLLDLHPDYYPAGTTPPSADEPALFTPPAANPPMIFQIDGNLGGTAAVLEMLVQYREETAVLLPACPAAWKSGHVEGIFLPGGHELRFAFAEQRLTALSVRLGFAGQLRFGGAAADCGTVTGTPGSWIDLLPGQPTA